MGWQGQPHLKHSNSVSPDGNEMETVTRPLEMRFCLLLAGVRLPGGAVGTKEKRCLIPTPTRGKYQQLLRQTLLGNEMTLFRVWRFDQIEEEKLGPVLWAQDLHEQGHWAL